MSVLFVAFLLLLLATGSYSRDKPARIDTEIAIIYIEKVKPELPKQDEFRQIMQDEGYRPCRYEDTEGHITIGFGHKVGKHSPKSKCISKDLAIALLEVDYRRAVKDVKRRWPWAKGDAQQVLFNMSYQLGGAGLGRFELFLADLKAGKNKSASEHMLDSLWFKQTPERVRRLAKRIANIKERR